MARSRMALLFPTFPPRASSASTMATSHQRDTDIFERRGNRRVRFVDRDPHRAHARKIRQHGIGDAAGGRLDEAVSLAAEGFGRAIHDLVVGHRIDHLVRAGGGRQVDFKIEVEQEGLPHLGLVRHDAMIGMQGQTFDENPVTHRTASIAALTRSAWTVSETSWARTIAAPDWTANRCAAIDPPMRSCGGEGVTELMKRLREAPTSSGKPKDLNPANRARQMILCSGVLPKPIPGASTILSRAMPARAAISSERVKKAFTSAAISMPGSAASRLCITITGTLRFATSGAMSLSFCSPQTSFMIAAPWSSAQAAVEALMVSIDTGTPSLTTSGTTVANRAFSSSADTGTASRSRRVDSAPISRMSPPCRA